MSYIHRRDMINTQSKQYLLAPFTLSILALLLVGITGCDADTEQDLGDRSWTLVWSDEFDAEAGESVDREKWTFDIGRGNNGWGNNELQYYTDRLENVSHDGEGNLVITAKQENFSGSPFTSGRIKTQGLFTQQYGRFEARLKTPYSQGLWPAFWMLGENITEVSWPLCGEIDIMELRGQLPSQIAGTVHGPGYSAANSVGTSFNLVNDRFDTEFHVFAVEWDADKIDFFVDDRMYQRITPEDVPGDWVFDTPFFMLLNVAVGGNYVGPPSPTSVFDQTMVIDYVRVYQ